MSRGQRIARNSLLNAVDTVFGFGAGFITSVLLARALGPKLLGEFNYVLWVVSILLQLAVSGIPPAMRRYASAAIGGGDEARARIYIRFSFWAQTALGTALTALMLFWALSQWDPERLSYAVPALLSVTPALVLAVFTYAIGAKEDFLYNVVPSILSNAVNLAGTVLVLVFDGGLPWLSVVILLARLVDAGVRYAGFRRLFGPVLRPAAGRLLSLAGLPADERRAFLRFTGGALLLMVVWAILLSRCEVWFLKRWWPVEEVTFFLQGFNFTDRINLIPLAVAGAVAATVMVEAGRGRDRTAALSLVSLRYMALVAFPMLAGLAAVSAPLMRLVYGAPFEKAIVPMAVQCLLLIPRALLLPAMELLTTADRQRTVIVWGWVACALNLALDAWWIRLWASVGAALANGVAQALFSVLMWWFVARVYRVRLPLANLGRILTASLGMGAAVYALSRPLAPVAGLPVGIIAGVVLYPVLLRVTGSLTGDDNRRLGNLEIMVPGPLRTGYRKLIGFLAPAPQPAEG